MLVDGIPLSFVSMLSHFTLLVLMFAPFFLAHLWLAAYPMPGLLQASAAQDHMDWLGSV